MEILSKDTIKTDILPNLSIGKRGLPVSEETRVAIVECILYKLKTGCQWAFVPVQQFVKEKDMTWQNIYYHFLKWSKEHLFFMLWISILKKYKKHLDLSCIQLDGSQTPCGGQWAIKEGSIVKQQICCFWRITKDKCWLALRRKKGNIMIYTTFKNYLKVCAKCLNKRD